MTETEFGNEFLALQQSWDSWQPSGNEMRRWLAQFKSFDASIFRAAVQTHFEERGEKQSWMFKPDNTRLNKLCWQIKAQRADSTSRERMVAYSSWLFNQRPVRRWRCEVANLTAAIDRGTDPRPLDRLHGMLALARRRLQVAEAAESKQPETGVAMWAALEDHARLIYGPVLGMR